jgi:hypothetical protein
MPLPLIIGAAAGAIVKTLKTKYVIQNKKGLYFCGMHDRCFLFLKWVSPQWESSQINAKIFSSIDDANQLIFFNKLRGAVVVKED